MNHDSKGFLVRSETVQLLFREGLIGMSFMDDSKINIGIETTSQAG